MADTGKGIFGYFVGRPPPPSSLCDARRYEFQELEKATNKFRTLIMPGVSGDHGSVYKGELRGRKDIAVVTLKREGKLVKQHEELVKEVSALSHKNLLKLDGYCIDEKGSFLCYEYQRYQTLEECLLRPVHQQKQGTIKKLSWKQRLDILTGICDGLIRLMEFKSKAVKMDIDLKVDKILLYDEDNKGTGLTPKLSLCIVWGQPDDKWSGYYSKNRHQKSFSSPEVVTRFGILLLMMIVTDKIKTSSTEKQLIDQVKHHLKQKDLDALRDPCLSSDSQAEINQCIELALDCIEKYAAFKPTVEQITSRLSNLVRGNNYLSNLGRGNNYLSNLGRGSYSVYNNYNPTVGGYNVQKLYSNLQYKIGHEESSDGLGHIKVDHLREYRYDELVRATDNFSSDRETGRGAFAVVYKGELDGKTFAVKKLQKDKFSEQFLNEVNILSGLRHRNLMKLEGYCFHTQGTMLCYEYLPDGTLQDRLQGDKHPKLTWNERYNIILGICRGLQYLHDECPDDVRIVHMDLKADNILFQIDANGALIPKIGDFGISWPLQMDKQHEFTKNPLGNIMCTPPEYQHGGKITTGLDIYSFGLIMLEVIAGQPRTYSRKSSRYGGRIINQAQIQMKQQDLSNFIDQSMGNNCLEQIQECIKIALDCVGSDEKTRPDIAHVSLRLVQIGQKQTAKKLIRSTASRRDETSMDKRVPVMGEHEKNNADIGSQISEVDALESTFKMTGSDTMSTDNTSGTINDQQQECSGTLSTYLVSYASVDGTPTNASKMPVPYSPSDLDFTLDFEAIFEGPSVVELESTASASPAKPEMEMEKALKQLYEALCELSPYQITEASVFIEEMVNKIFTKRSPSTDRLTNCLNELLAIISSDSDAIKRARDRAARKIEINEKKSRCSKLKAIMRDNASEAKVLGKQLAFITNRKEILCAELKKIDSQLKDIPASIAEKKKKGMEAQAEGKILAEEVVREEAEIGDTSADDALLKRLRKIHGSVCTQLEGVIDKI